MSNEKINLFSDLFATASADDLNQIVTKVSADDFGNADIPSATDVLLKAQERAFLRKGVYVTDDLDTPIRKTAALPERSEQRLQKAKAVLDRIFGWDPELREQATEIFRQALADARNAVLAA